MNEKNGYVELRNINKNFGDFQASKDINISISRGKLVALLGPSGSGKTTILRMIAGLEHPDSGQILIDGKVVNDVPGSERGIGFVFQSYALFRYMTKNGIPASSRADSANVSPLRGPWLRTRRSCCSTSPSRRSTPRSAWNCAPGCGR